MQRVSLLFAGSLSSKPRSANIFFSETKQNLFLILVQEKASAASGKNEYLDDVAAVAAIKRAPPHTSVRLDRNRHDTREFAQFLTTAAAAEAHKRVSPTTYDLLLHLQQEMQRAVLGVL